MPSLRRIAVGLVAASAVSASGAGSFAQGPAGVGAGGGGLARMVGSQGGANYLMVLMTPAVQEELKLSEDQKGKVFDLAREAQQKGRAMTQAMLQGGGTPQAYMQAGAKIRQENEAAAAKILKPEQKERVDQIMLQIEGPLAVVRPEIAAKLNMTPKQNQQAQMTVLQMAQEVRQMMMAQGGGGNNGFNPVGAAGLPRAAMNQLHGAANKQLGRVLDAKQKFNFNKMLGEPFDLSKIDPDLARPASPTASDDPAPAKSEKSRARRKGAAAARGSAAKAAAAKAAAEDDEKPKP